FFQAEDGIRDFHVTGVQTCALPIWRGDELAPVARGGVARADTHAHCWRVDAEAACGLPDADERGAQVAFDIDAERLQRRDVQDRSEERRVGEEGWWWWSVSLVGF